MPHHSIQDSQRFVKLSIIKLGETGQSLSSNRFLVELRGLEPLTPSVQRRCSPVLSYSPLPSNYSIIPLVPQEVKARQTHRWSTATHAG
jgi:hypothetical protein